MILPSEIAIVSAMNTLPRMPEAREISEEPRNDEKVVSRDCHCGGVRRRMVMVKFEDIMILLEARIVRKML